MTKSRTIDTRCSAPLSGTVCAVLLAVCASAQAAGAGESMANALGRVSEVTLHLRSYYVDRLNPGGVQNAAWALGGWAGYKTGWIADALEFGVVGHTSQRLSGPETRSPCARLKSAADR